MDLGLSDRVYIVTGASRGLGRATAEALVADGAKVVVSSRSGDSLAAVVEDLGSDHVEAVVADNSDESTPQRLIGAARTRFGRIDGGLISVGGPAPGPVTKATEEHWRAAFESVFLGGIRMATALADALSEGGSIALVLSTSVKQPIGGLAISNGLRPGLAMVAKTLADEVGPRGIRVNGLMPGRVDTERVRELDELSGDAASTRAAMTESIPLRRYGDPADFGRAAAFLLSPAAAYITGVMLPVDGGMTRCL
jgi:3-oxoacyl-[acyl-carrier protein] reductase